MLHRERGAWGLVIILFVMYNINERDVRVRRTLEAVVPPANTIVLEKPSAPPAMQAPRKVYRFLKDAGFGIGNMQAPLFFDDVDELRGLLIVDVGACDGSDWSVPAVKKRGHTVLAFEPMPGNQERFMQTVRDNGLEGVTEVVQVLEGAGKHWHVQLGGKIYLFPAGVSNRTGAIKMHAAGELASMHPQDFYPESDLNRGQTALDVPVVTLDSVLGGRGEGVHLLKIDVQGHELGVLQGARRLFEEGRINMVNLEFWPKGMSAGGEEGGVAVLDFLHGYGFMCFDYSRNRHVPADRPSRFEEFVASFDGGRDHGFGAWDELVCFHV